MTHFTTVGYVVTLPQANNGAVEAVKTHMNGLSRMIALRGGFMEANFPPTIQRQITWYVSTFQIHRISPDTEAGPTSKPQLSSQFPLQSSPSLIHTYLYPRTIPPLLLTVHSPQAPHAGIRPTSSISRT